MSSKWDDPIFGQVPETFRTWYELNSGTIYKDGRWLVKFPTKQANDFQERLISAKAKLRHEISVAGDRSSSPTLTNVYEYMINHETRLRISVNDTPRLITVKEFPF